MHSCWTQTVLAGWGAGAGPRRYQLVSRADPPIQPYQHQILPIIDATLFNEILDQE